MTVVDDNVVNSDGKQAAVTVDFAVVIRCERSSALYLPHHLGTELSCQSLCWGPRYLVELISSNTTSGLGTADFNPYTSVPSRHLQFS